MGTNLKALQQLRKAAATQNTNSELEYTTAKPQNVTKSEMQKQN